MQDFETEREHEESPAEPRKLLLGKRVLRHLSVRTGVQAGNTSANASTTRQASPTSATKVLSTSR